MNDGDFFLLKTAFTFDIFGTEIYGWLFGEGTLAILPMGAEADPLALAVAIREFGITHINVSPTMLRLLLDAVLRGGSTSDLNSLRYIFSGGEALTPDITRRFFALDLPCTLENVYGPTEASMWATHGTVHRADLASIAPIGRALNDYRIYVLGADDALLGTGLPGELCIAGAGVAVGYLNRDELNDRHFIANPFFDEASDHDRMRRMYRTGDLGYLREDGRFAFLRRIDRQVKIGGVRIELGEIEHALHALEGVIEAAVVVDGSSGIDRLVAFFTAYRPMSASELRQALTASLLPNRIPSLFTQLTALPTSAAGKLDRRSLLSLLAEDGEQAASATAATVSVTPHVAALAGTAQRSAQTTSSTVGGSVVMGAAAASIVVHLRAIWQDVLGIDESMTADLNASFFNVGGNSLSLMRLQFVIGDELGHELAITDLLRATSISEQAKLIAEASTEAHSEQQAPVAMSALSIAQVPSDLRTADIAIIGIGVQVPGAADVHEFWQHLRAGDETITFYDDDELRLLGVPEHELQDPLYVKANGRLDGVDGFDSALFRVPPAEIDVTSPQLRLLYECFWEACEDAGYDPTDLPGRVGVFVVSPAPSVSRPAEPETDESVREGMA